MKTIAKLLTFLLMCLMFTLWGAWTFFPEAAMLQYQVSAETITGINLLKSEMGAVVLAIGLFLLLYFMLGSKWLYPAMLTTFALLLGRVVSLFMDGFSTVVLGAAGMETVSILTFLYLAKKHPTPYDYVDLMHPSFRKLGWIKNQVKPLWMKKMMSKLSTKLYHWTPLSKQVEKKRYKIKAYQGKERKVEVYQLKDSTAGSPCIIAYHCGGFWNGPMAYDKKIYDLFARATEAKVVYIEYTRSLETPYPAAAEDCYATALWVYENAKMLGIDPDRIAFYGDSAGGNLATVVSLMLRDRGQFKPCLQALIYPVTSYGQETESAKKYTAVPVWCTAMTKEGNRLYLGEHQGEIPAYAFPLNAKDLTNLPPTYLEVAEFDSLRDDGLAYAEKLKKAGNQLVLNEVKGNCHAFELVFDSEVTRKALRRRIVAFERAFAGGEKV